MIISALQQLLCTTEVPLLSPNLSIHSRAAKAVADELVPPVQVYGRVRSPEQGSSYTFYTPVSIETIHEHWLAGAFSRQPSSPVQPLFGERGYAYAMIARGAIQQPQAAAALYAQTEAFQSDRLRHA